MTRSAATQPRPPEPPGTSKVSDGVVSQVPVIPAPARAKIPSAEVVVAASSNDAEALLAFNAEEAATRKGGPAGSPKKRSRWKLLLIATIAVLVAAAAGAGYWYWRVTQAQPLPSASAPPAPAPVVVEGTATISSRPEGATVFVNGAPRGITPLKLALPVGEHTLELQNGPAKRSVPLVIAAGTISSQYIDLAPAAGATGRLEVTSDPPGADVAIDGSARGSTPLVMATIAAGPHRVVISDGQSTVTRNVTVAAGATATVVASLAPAGPAAGWVAIKAPLELQVYENGHLVGTSSADRLMLPAGRRELELVNTALEFRTAINVQVVVGRTATATVTLPNGSLSINALPWADVWLDGRALGTTPLANLTVAIGTHEIVWRHPQFGERRQTVTVTAKSPVRVGVDLRK
jgi:hypothetical protein